MKNEKVAKNRTNPASQSGVQLTEPGIGPKSGNQRAEPGVWRVGHPSLSLCSASQAKPRISSYSRIQRSVYGQIDSQSNGTDQKILSPSRCFFKRNSYSGTGRFSKAKRAWPGKKTTRRLSLDSSLIAWGVRSCLWLIGCWFPYQSINRLFQ